MLTATAVRYEIRTDCSAPRSRCLVADKGVLVGLAGQSFPLATQIEDLQVALGYDRDHNG